MEELDFIRKIRSLPTPTPVLRRIAGVAADPSSSMTQVADALRLDPSIAGKVLRLANSAYIGMPRSVASLQNAVTLLGLKRVQSIVMVSQFVQPFGAAHTTGPFSLERFWRHSITVALIAESIGRHRKRYEATDEQELFTAGLLHDIGKIALAVHDPSLLARAHERGADEKIPFFKAEGETISHTAIGALLADQWGFPAELGNAIAHHHEPQRSKTLSRAVAVIHLADIMVHLIGYSTFENEIHPSLCDDALRAAGLPPERLRIIAETEVENESRIEELCEIFRDRK